MNPRAVSPLIGFILLLTILMGVYGIIQSQVVPQWNRGAEARHLDELSLKLGELSDRISVSAVTGSDAKLVVGAGVSYPEKYIFVSPSKASTTVFAKNLEVRINGIAHIGSQDIEYDRTFTSSAIVLKPNYLYSESVELVYEHSAVLLKYGSAVVARSGQESFSPDAMNLYIVNASFDSFATTEEVTFVIHPVSYGNAVSFNGTVEFECYDEETARWWEETLERFYELKRDGARIEINFSGSLSINYVKVYASPKGEVREEETPKPRHIVPILNNSTTYNLLAGQTWDFGVLVLDEYLNPIRDAKILYNESVISISIEGSCGNVGKCTKHVKAGEVWCSFSSPHSVLRQGKLHTPRPGER